MAEQSSNRRIDAVLAGVGLMLGVTGALCFAAWRAISREGIATSERWSEFGEALFFPGLLIVVAIAAMVWLGWKANIDG